MADHGKVKEKSVVGAIFSAVKALMMLIIDLVGVASEATAILDKNVRMARERQAVELDITHSEYANLAVTKAASDLMRAQEEVNAYVAQDQTGERKRLLELNMARLKAAVEKGQAEIALDRQSRQQ